MKIGIYGGTFNPPHKAHIRFAEYAAKKLSLDKVIVIPDKQPVHKVCSELAPTELRFLMCENAFSFKKAEVSRIELDRKESSFMYLTIRKLEKQFDDAEFYLIIGSDMFFSFDKWKNAEEILKKVTLVVAARNAEDKDKIDFFSKETLKVNPIILELEPFVVSSSEIRKKVKHGMSLNEYLTDEVIKIIKENGLYGYKQKS